MAVYIYVATSLDGFIAGPNGELDWLLEVPNPDQSDYGFAEFMSGIDAVVMGRNTFETVLSFGDWSYNKPVFVLSYVLQDVPVRLAGKAEILNGDVGALVSQLEERGYRNLYVDGGRVIQSFLEQDLVDEMIITRVPILLGGGIPLFGKSAGRLEFEHKNTVALNETLTKSHYTRVRSNGT
ncbi:MAG: dihydrofolate reductase [Gemmatimonadota bacterium]|nr:MAG: dihydrofolate reductase [Gemmatimonadota bacterium]